MMTKQQEALIIKWNNDDYAKREAEAHKAIMDKIAATDPRRAKENSRSMEHDGHTDYV